MELEQGYVRISLNDPPIGAPFIVDVHVNGLSLFTTLIQIDTGEVTSVGSLVPYEFAFTFIEDDALFEAYVMQVGSTVGATGFKLAITGIKTEDNPFTNPPV